MDAHVGANGPGAMGRSNFTSGESFSAPSGTLSSGKGFGMSGIGGNGGKANAVTDVAINNDRKLNFAIKFIYFQPPHEITANWDSDSPDKRIDNPRWWKKW